MNYRSIAELSVDVLAWTRTLPRDFDLVVGIPRSGLLVANMLALYMGLPLTDIDGLLAGRIFKAGLRCTSAQQDSFLSQKQKVLIVDDTVLSGGQLNQNKNRVGASGLIHEIYWGVMYPGNNSVDVDYAYKVLPWPRCFEWNLLDHGILENACVDIDGVLCRDPTGEENDDGPKYMEFIRSVRPEFVPSRRIRYVVTCRLEKYREQTEDWLKRSGIPYSELIMLDMATKEERLKLGPYSAFKASIYRRTGAGLFIESSTQQAMEIANLASNYVLCWGDRRMYAPGFLPQQRIKAEHIIKVFMTNPVTALKKVRMRLGYKWRTGALHHK